VAGKAEWMAYGLPVEGKRANAPRIDAIAHRDVPRVRLDESVVEVRTRLGDWEIGIVVDERDAVLGVVRAEAVAVDTGGTVGDVMQEGPSTYRPDVAPAEIARQLRESGAPRTLVTRADGTLIGLVRIEDLPPADDVDDGP
jgi:CBS domain-containing protein